LVLLETISMKVGFENCGIIVSPLDFSIIARTHVRLPYSFSGWIFLQLDVLKKKYVKLGTEKMVSPTCYENVARTHARVPYSILGLMVVHFESVRLEKMSMTLENLVETMSPIYFKIVAHFQERLPYSFLNQIFL